MFQKCRIVELEGFGGLQDESSLSQMMDLKPREIN